MSTQLCFTPATELALRIRRGDLSPVEVVDAHLDRIERRNDALNAFTALYPDHARERAREAERALEAGEAVGPLHGVPVAIKELGYLTEGMQTTFGSKPFADFVPERDDVSTRRLKEAGAIVIGKTNTPEFGHKGTTDNLIFGPTSTPFDVGRNAGGSSGGSAAAAAAGMAPLTMGGDVGGSIRIPAAWCGVYGLKPSFGRIPRDPRPNAFSKHTPFGHTGPMTRTVEEAALVLDVLGRPSPRDPFSLPAQEGSYLAATRRPIDDLTVAYTPDFDVFPIEESVRAVVDDAVDALGAAGATVERVSPGFERPHHELYDAWETQIEASYGALVRAQAANGVDLLGEHREDVSPQLVELMERGVELSATEYLAADTVRTAVYDALQGLLAEYDLLVSPTVSAPPVENADDGTQTLGPSEVDGEPVDPLLGWAPTYLCNFTGHPAASVPAGLTDEELPVGLQITGRRFADDTVLAASAAFERVRPWHDDYPGR
ncbi:amidase [Haloglomus litoreum]|uniref:amidase n=1 Tax=Haloglomus litoreum TaxID=3034026 RepID=UPI0023E81698|nr:amidase [Haloglomus sp. DT116]